MPNRLIENFLQAEQLPGSYAQIFTDVLLPLAAALALQQEQQQKQQHGATLRVGINGAQGTGKTTVARALSLLLQEYHQCTVATLSLDDFYLTRAQRRVLAASVHPLLATRGVPGTHDIELLAHTMEALSQAAPTQVTRIPRFNKAMDDRVPDSEFTQNVGSPDIVLLEGWCIGVQPQTAHALEMPVNALESQQDEKGIWRHHVNAQLAGEYRKLFDTLDMLLMLKAPSFACVHEWRCLQESKLAASAQGVGLMSRAQLATFVQHYERLTRHALDTLPDEADIVLHLDEQHHIVKMTLRPD